MAHYDPQITRCVSMGWSIEQICTKLAKIEGWTYHGRAWEMLDQHAKEAMPGMIQ